MWFDVYRFCFGVAQDRLLPRIVAQCIPYIRHKPREFFIKITLNGVIVNGLCSFAQLIPTSSIEITKYKIIQ
jgi:hypothetical protein